MRLIVDICLKKAQKGFWTTKGRRSTKFFLQDLQDDPFGRLRAGRISSVEGALRVLRNNTLGINAGCALSKRASSGPAGFDPATLSPCEAWFG